MRVQREGFGIDVWIFLGGLCIGIQGGDISLLGILYECSSM